VSVREGLLTLAGKREGDLNKDGEHYCACERWYGGFTRTVSVPDAAEIGRAHV
jgi:HSP20 family molecular chaperone IbpA